MKALVLYGSKYGCTRECAYLLGEQLGGADVVDICREASISLDDYDTVLIGSSVYAGRISKAVAKFCATHLNILKQKQIGLFICCAQPDKAMEQLVNGFPSELVESARAKGYFGHQPDIAKLNLLERLIVRAVGKRKDELNILHDAISSFAKSFT